VAPGECHRSCVLANWSRISFTALACRTACYHLSDLVQGAGKANARAPVSISMLKQIAGRSGRRNSEYAEGLATTLRNPDVTTLRKALEAPPSALKTPSAGLFPEFEHLEVPTCCAHDTQ